MMLIAFSKKCSCHPLDTSHQRRPAEMADLLHCCRLAWRAATSLLTRFRFAASATSDQHCSSRCNRKRSTLQSKQALRDMSQP